MIRLSSLAVGGGAGATIKSIQQVSLTLPDTDPSATATITAVVMANTVLLFNGTTLTDAANGHPKIVLTNTTTITADRVGSQAGDIHLRITVIEFEDGSITGVQRGTITMTPGNGSNTATITAVDTSKSVVLALGVTSTGSGNDTGTHLVLTNATTVTATRGGTAGQTIASFEVLEFA